LKLLREAQQRIEDAEQRIEDAEQRAEEEKQQRQQEQQRAEEAERQMRRTTLGEYLEACHDLVFSKFAVEADKSLTSQGYWTDPSDKRCPARLAPWTDFLQEQRATFRTLSSAFPEEAEAFESKITLRDLGDRVARRKVADERGLEYFQHICVEDPVLAIFERLVLDDTIKDEFDLGDGIAFVNHPNAVSDVAREAVARRAAQQQPPSTPARAGPDHNRLRPDQTYVYKRGGDGGRSMAYVIEHKAPHKLTPPQLRLGLRDMDIHREVVDRATKPTADDPEGLFRYHAERLAAAAVTQTFHHMIEGGLEHGLLTTGEAAVFLKVD